MRRWQLLILALPACLGCTLDFSEVGPYGGASSSGGEGSGANNDAGGGGSTSTGVTSCTSRGGVCAPGAPDGWKGPAILVAGGSDTCPPPSIVTLQGGKSLGIDAQPICECVPLEDSCINPHVLLYSAANCAPQAEDFLYLVTEEPCQLANPMFSISSMSVSLPETVPNLLNDCGVATPHVPLYDEPTDVCMIEGPDDCGDGEACLPATGQRCIYREGVQECPESWGTAIALVTAQTECPCGSAFGADCTGARLDIWDAASCGGPPDQNIALSPVTGACIDVELGSSFQTRFEPTKLAECAQVTPTLAVDDYTACCVAL